jgi:hypothetical protein
MPVKFRFFYPAHENRALRYEKVSVSRRLRRMLYCPFDFIGDSRYADGEAGRRALHTTG